MNAVSAPKLFEKITALPQERLAEIELFVDFVTARENAAAWSNAVAKLSEGSFAAVWDNDEDAVYDAL